MKTQVIKLALVATGLFVSATSASAACTTFSGGGVSVEECPISFPSGLQLGGTYRLTNNSGQSIFAFAVSTQNAADSTPYAPADWYAMYIPETQWNMIYTRSFNDTFGLEDTGAYFYVTQGQSIATGTATAPGDYGFRFGVTESNFVAFDRSGGVIAQSFVSAVPEPGTYGMMLAGLGVLVAFGKRRKAC